MTLEELLNKHMDLASRVKEHVEKHPMTLDHLAGHAALSLSSLDHEPVKTNG